jgi:hypothetical protein
MCHLAGDEIETLSYLRTSALLGTPSVQSVHDYYPFALEDGGRLAPMAAELVDRLAILVAVRRFPGMGAADSRSLCSENYVRMQHFVRSSNYFYSFSAFFGGCATRVHATSFCCSSYGTLGSCLRDALKEGGVIMLWHAFMFLGLRLLPIFFFLLRGLCCFFF